MTTDPRSVTALMARLESYYDFQCQGGPLTLCVEWQQLKAALRTEAARPEPDVERLAEHLIAIYGCAVSQGGRLVKHGAHPGERVSQQFIAVLQAAFEAGKRSQDSGAEADALARLRQEMEHIANDKVQWLCEPCNTVHTCQRPGKVLQPCPDCGAAMIPSSTNIRKIKELEAALAHVTADYETERRKLLTLAEHSVLTDRRLAEMTAERDRLKESVEVQAQTIATKYREWAEQLAAAERRAAQAESGLSLRADAEAMRDRLRRLIANPAFADTRLVLEIRLETIDNLLDPPESESVG